ncbi:MAG: hypothetical protein ACPGWM_02435 [Flavobacteriales bacterium]
MNGLKKETQKKCPRLAEWVRYIDRNKKKHMKKFLALYHSSAEAQKMMQTAAPEQQKAAMQKWLDWKMKNQKHIVDFGAPTTPSQMANSTLNWQSTGSTISGYSVFQASSEQELKTTFTDHPHLSWAEGASIELSELINF